MKYGLSADEGGEAVDGVSRAASTSDETRSSSDGGTLNFAGVDVRMLLKDGIAEGDVVAVSAFLRPCRFMSTMRYLATVLALRIAATEPDTSTTKSVEKRFAGFLTLLTLIASWFRASTSSSLENESNTTVVPWMKLALMLFDDPFLLLIGIDESVPVLQSSSSSLHLNSC